MKTLYKIGMLAVAALAFVGCSKEVDNSADQKTGTHTLTFKVIKDVDTKTAVVEGDGVASYVWTEKDDQYFHIYENGVEASEITMDLSDDNKIATFKATFDDTDATEFSYTAVYGSEVSNSGNPMIISEQSPVLDSFDPAADVLVSAKPITLEGNVAADKDTEFLFSLKRVASVNKMTLKGLTAGEKIATVELASDKNFSARYMVDKDSYTGNLKKLVLDYSALDDAVVGTDGTFPVYFVSAPVEDATFSVRVVTESMVYARDNFTSKLTLAVGTFRRFGINLSGYGTPIQTATVYKLVEDNEKIVDGAEYLIVAKDKGKAAGAYNTSKYYNAESVTVADKAISISAEAVQVFTLEAGATAGQFNIKDSDGKYVKWSSGNSVEQSTTGYLWTVTKDGIASVNTPDRKLQYNSGSPRFACYTSTQTAIELYVNEATLVELADPELSFEGEATIEVDWADIEDFTAPTLNNPHNVTVTYSSSNPDVATVDATTGEIEFVGDGTTIITASSTKTDVYKAGSAQYTLVVSGAPVPLAFTTVAELNALASTAGEYFGSLTNAVISFAPDTKNAVIKDATGSVLVFKDNHGYKQGQTFTGELTISLTKYNNASEITAIDATFEGNEAVVAPQSVTLADLVGNFATWQNAYVVVEDLEVASTSGKNINVKNGTNTYVVYSSAANATCVTGDIIKVTGTIAQYSSKDQVKAWTADDIMITQEHQKAKHTITFAQPEEGGTFTVSANGAQISSGTELDEDTVVTLAATAADGFSFGGWRVSGANVSGNTATATFTVGTADVTIAAIFVSNDLTEEEISGTLTMVDGSLTLTTSSGITVVQAKGTSTTNVNNSYNTISTLRVYKGHTLSFSGKTIKKIEITVDGTYYGNTLEANTGVITPTTTSGGTIVWEGSSDSITITNAATASNVQLRTKKIVVYY